MARARSLAALAVAAAAVPTLAHSSILPRVQTPTFNCDENGSINWGDSHTTGSIIIVAIPGSVDKQTTGFSCDAGLPAVQLNGPGDFTINFGSFGDGSVDKWDIAQKVTPYSDKWFTEDKYKVYDFNLLLPAVMPSGAKVDNFLGVQWKFVNGDTYPGTPSFQVDENGNLILDPSIPQNGIQVSLYSSPVASPEPTALMLLGTGLAGIAGAFRGKKKD